MRYVALGCVIILEDWHVTVVTMQYWYRHLVIV